MRRSAGKRQQQSHTRMRFTVGVDVRVDVSAGIRGVSRQLSGWDDDGDVREDHDHATNRPQMMKTMFRRGIPPPSAIHAARTHRHVCTSLDVAGTFYSHWEPPLQRKERKEDPSYTARKPTVLIIIIIRTSDIKQD